LVHVYWTTQHNIPEDSTLHTMLFTFIEFMKEMFTLKIDFLKYLIIFALEYQV
jgi:hypothetical protein